MKSRIKELDALRGIASLAVVLHHYSIYRAAPLFNFKYGVMGVELFFIISGFVILMTIEKVIKWQDFVVGRFSRLYPAYWTCLFFGTLFANILNHFANQFHFYDKMSTSDIVISFLANITMFQYFFKIINLDPVYWTLTIEMVFYILVLLLFRFNSIKNIEKFSFILLCFSFFHSLGIINHFNLYKEFIFFLPIINYFPLFFTGILVYKIKKNEKSVFRLVLIPFCFVIQTLLYTNTMASMHLNKTEYVIILLVIYSLISLFVLSKLSFIVNKITLWLGDISYSLYLCHFFIGCGVIIPGLSRLSHRLNENYWIILIIALSAALIFATLINKYIERPVIKLIRKTYYSKQ